jgi:DNA-directed RNA polymerase subunit M/transcription elongation factor TFIIS
MNEHPLTPLTKSTIDIINQISKDINEDSKWITSQVYEDIQHLKRTLSEDQLASSVQQYLQNLKLGWNHPVFAQHAKNQQEEDDYILTPFEVEEGVVECPRCKSFKVLSMSVQTRSADEPTTTVAECIKCKLKWTQNS